ncbi:MAG TPA: LLM class flavin-dependent oxidoreductase [Longimicrobiaceae bacterium]|nr:LLM class flavin-dependent oxidoreductase [Longimicrobiaceae bacterium]
MKIGLFFPFGHTATDRSLVAKAGRTAEDLGFDSLWLGEHVVLFPEYESRYPYAEGGQLSMPAGWGLLGPFTTLAFLAAVTSRIRLGTGVCLLPAPPADPLRR